MARLAERQRVHRRDRARAHGEDVAQDAADAGRRPLVGLDIAGVVVAFHLEHHRLAVADIDDAGVFAGAADHLRAVGGQGAQPFLGGLVGAMFVPHGRKDAKFGEGGFASDNLKDPLIFIRRKPVGCDQVVGDGWLLHLVPRAVAALLCQSGLGMPL